MKQIVSNDELLFLMEAQHQAGGGCPHLCGAPTTSPDDADAMFGRIDGPKELMWLDTTNHIDLYDQPTYVDPAVGRIVEWETTHL